MRTKNYEEIISDSFSIEEKVAFLKKSEAYPFPVHNVEVKETHMSWVFLVDDFVYKLKKPVKYQYLDHRTLEARFRDCRREIRLNKKLAEDIYIGLVPITSNKEGALQLSGNGAIEEWLVKMKRIPEDTMLDYTIIHRCINEERLAQVAVLLTNFYKDAPLVMMSGSEYTKKLQKEITDNYKQLINPAYDLPEAVVEKLTNTLLNFLDNHASIFYKRVLHKKIIEAHGDLRPEHICLTSKPVIIDCLEFSRALRILDVGEELSYFAMECEMMGNAVPGKIFFETYMRETSDNIDYSLILFYKIKKACLRAYLVARHITEPNYKGDNGWLSKANAYIDLAMRYDEQLTMII